MPRRSASNVRTPIRGGSYLRPGLGERAELRLASSRDGLDEGGTVGVRVADHDAGAWILEGNERDTGLDHWLWERHWRQLRRPSHFGAAHSLDRDQREYHPD